jgi:RNA polymerase sigma-70 factor (ECF subfamily)
VTDEGFQLELPLDLLQQRDSGAFRQLVERHQATVLGLCQAMGLRGADCDDAAAEVFANVFRALPRFEGRSALGTWVYRIACRTIPKVRGRSRKHKSASLPEEQIDRAQASPLEHSQATEANEKIWAAVAQLPEREAMAVEMFYRHQWPIEQIASALECPQGTVKTLLFRARQKLKESLARQEIGI